MTLDFDEQQVDELLTRRARSWRQDFTAPPLEGMLAIAIDEPEHHARRWLWPIVAAVLLLAIPLITVLATRHRAQPAPPAKPVTELKLIGAAPWADAVLQADGRTVTVSHAFPKGSVQCGRGLPVLRATVIAQTRSQVVIAATAYESSQRPPADSLVCTTPGVQGQREDSAVVSLSSALGSRMLIDATDHKKHPVLRDDAIPQAGYVPAGFRHVGLSWSEESGYASRTYTNPEGTFSIIRRLNDEFLQSMFDQRDYGSQTVHGQLAKYQNWGATWHVSWSEGKYLWTVDQEAYNGAPIVQLAKATLFKVAQSLRW